MYYVYKLEFDGRIYVGCTNNIRRRKDQHNGNARNRKSKLGCFLADRSITLKTSDFVVLSIYKERDKALKEERRIAHAYAKEGVNLLNDNYSPDCTRIGKHIGNTSKEFVVIDCKENTATEVKDLRQYCIANGIDYKLIHRTTKSGHICHERYCAFSREDWENETEKEKYLDGSFVDEIRKSISEDISRRQGKTYLVLFPDGHDEIVVNLYKFAKEHNLTPGTLHGTYIKQKPTKGYQVIKRI